MLKKKGLVAMMLAGVLMVGNVCPVMAANTLDTKFTFQAGTSYISSDERPKENTTPVYVRVNPDRPFAEIMIYGKVPTPDKSSVFWKNCTYRSSPDKPLHVIAQSGKQHSIRSTVYEEGGRTAKLMGRSVVATVESRGVWSPDSAGRYIFLN